MKKIQNYTIETLLTFGLLLTHYMLCKVPDYLQLRSESDSMFTCKSCSKLQYRSVSWLNNKTPWPIELKVI